MGRPVLIITRHVEQSSNRRFIMVSQPITLRGHMHVCPMVDPGPKPHAGGPVSSTAQSFVCVDGVPIATVGDKCTCTGVPTAAGMTSGSSVAKIGGRPIARLDACEHGGRLVQGVPWLTIQLNSGFGQAPIGMSRRGAWCRAR
jgi:uncharacterized Zn-binding protein involved in type VI secretion